MHTYSNDEIYLLTLIRRKMTFHPPTLKSQFLRKFNVAKQSRKFGLHGGQFGETKITDGQQAIGQFDH
jgi:hypothetical protein